MQEMVSTPLIQFPVFTPTTTPPHRRRLATEVRFSRWNNANAEKFNGPKRTQKEIEDQLRFHKRYDSALNIAHSYSPAPPTPTFKSTGTPSAPSRPSIPGKKSKYSKPPQQNLAGIHPAFKPLLEPKKFSTKRGPQSAIPAENDTGREKVSVKIGDNGLAYELPDAPFVYQYSYTETPKVKPVGIREPLVAPFEPATMARPWTGRKPLSKKKLPEFDSFKLPPPNKKRVKTVQPPGPYLPGSGPKYVKSRKEILGEPLTKEEVLELVASTKKWKRQLNMGRDGFTHNMLENIHAHWKRRRVCKIKCKGVCTVDMANVRRQLEDKTGGQVIYSRGGLIYLFRGRNYNYRDRPRYPLMLWKPVSPVYPRLVQRVPDGLTLEEATEMRRKGRDLTPICKLGKNGVYCDLVKNVKEAFEACELVRINCQGMNGSDYRKIGAKLKDLVPCVLVSFENEHILMWRGRDWKSVYPEPKNDVDSSFNKLEVARATLPEASSSPVMESVPLMENTDEVDKKELEENTNYQKELIGSEEVSECDGSDTNLHDTIEVDREGDSSSSEVKELEEYIIHEKELVGKIEEVSASDGSDSNLNDTIEVDRESDSSSSEVNKLEENIFHQKELVRSEEISEVDSEIDSSSSEVKKLEENIVHQKQLVRSEEISESDGSDTNLGKGEPLIVSSLEDVSEDKKPVSQSPSSIAAAEEVKLLLKMAVENGSAMILEGSSLDPDMVYEQAVLLAKSAPPGPVFRYGLKKKKVLGEGTEQSSDDLAKKEDAKPSDLKLTVSKREKTVKKGSKRHSAKDILTDVLNISPKGTLRVDELAKLLG